MRGSFVTVRFYWTCSYRRITTALYNRGIHLNHKTVQRLMKQLGLVCRVRIK
ncbi:IS3 family transposase, partial [Pseudoflavonifractor phocaeensis]|uniref:IS3 family transposase n=1 Tax=Pseudoflavonifractor phocaeensis TaxID=1870988 RepID=UPI00195C2F26|nr:transposase [Pseudoflavonifractor phocaeensis]